MTNVNTPERSRLSRKAASRLSMISILAISAGTVAAPVQAQQAAAAPAPVEAAPVISPQPAAPPSPTMVVPAPVPVVKAEPAPNVPASRADDLATRGGFDAGTVAPEALAQIEQEQQARKDAAAAAAAETAASKAATARSVRPAANSAPSVGSPVADSAAPTVESDGSSVLAAGTAGDAAVMPMTEPMPELATAPEPVPADGEADWSLLAALAALLGVGGAGAYAATRRRKSKTREATALNAAIMPELRADPAGPVRATVGAAPAPAAPTESERATAKTDLAEFVATLPAFDESPRGPADGNVKIGLRRVAPASRPYLDEADLARPAGYFTANVDSMPTPQNPFLTRQKRIKRARYLDGKLAEWHASQDDRPTKIVGKMKTSKPLEPAFA